MNRREFGLSGLSKLALLAVMGCSVGKGQAAEVSAPAATSAAQQYALASRAHGFSVGSMMAANTAYIFFDPLCGHCGTLWRNAKSLAGKAQLVWIPIALLSRASMPLSAEILAADNPFGMMDEHENRMKNARKRLAATPQSHPEEERAVQENTEIFKKMKAQGVPLIVYKNAVTGAAGVAAGQMSAQQLAVLLGLS